MLAKVALGEADAGFVYSTDAKTVPGKVNVIKIPAWAQPKVTYAIGDRVRRARNKAAAKTFIDERLEQGRPEEAARCGLPAACRAK